MSAILIIVCGILGLFLALLSGLCATDDWLPGWAAGLFFLGFFAFIFGAMWAFAAASAS